MRLRTLLNHCHKLKSFVYKNERLEESGSDFRIVVDIEPRKNSRPKCSRCNAPGTIYDHQSTAREFEFVPAWGTPVYFSYVMRRVNCKRCGVKIESVPWCDGKNQLTNCYRIFLARWARRLSWKEVGECFQVSWDKVYRSVQYVVEYGLKNRDLDHIEAIGVDEIQYGKGHQYLTLVYQLNDKKRLLYISQKRTVKSFLGFFRILGKERSAKIKYVG